jgi:hypothetical protein
MVTALLPPDDVPGGAVIGTHWTDRGERRGARRIAGRFAYRFLDGDSMLQRGSHFSAVFVEGRRVRRDLIACLCG